MFLTDWVSSAAIWSYFDGWCAAQNVDHEELPWDRWLNLVYYFAVRNASTEDADKFDNAMRDCVTAWHLAKAQPVIEQARNASTPERVPEPGGRQRRMPPRPAGWGDDKRATFDNKAAITTLTAGGVSGKNRRK